MYVGVCMYVCVCMYACMCIFFFSFLFLQRKPYVRSCQTFSCWYDETVFRSLFSKEHVEDGWRREGGRDHLFLGERNPSFFFRLETKSALKIHKTQAGCVVSSPTDTSSLSAYKKENKNKKKTVKTEKRLCFSLTMRQSRDCSSCGAYEDMSTTAQ